MINICKINTNRNQQKGNKITNLSVLNVIARIKFFFKKQQQQQQNKQMHMKAISKCRNK
jgi:hypothetical protein